MKNGRKILSILLTLALVLGLMSGGALTARADGGTTSSWTVNSDNTLSLSATAAQKAIGTIPDNSVKMVLIGTIGGTISNLPSGTGVTTKTSTDETAAMVLYDASQTNASVQTMLRGIKFSSGTTQVHIDVTTGTTTEAIKADITSSNTTFGLLNSAGEAHAYKYISSGSSINWITAYHNAVTGANQLGGLKGYLATVTTSAEANLLNQFYRTAAGSSTQGAWIAGTSLKYSTSNSSSYDGAGKITPTNHSSCSSSSVAGLKITADSGAYYCPSTTSSYASFFYWACGPEQGERVSSSLWANGEPNNSGGEYCAVSSWGGAAQFNDLSPFAGVGGYFLEFSAYNGGVDGAYNTITIYKVAYDKNEATSGTAPAPQEKFKGEGMTLSENVGSLAKSGGKTFSGWNTNASGTGTDYAVGGTYSSDNAATLYAKWTNTPATAPTITTQPAGQILTYGYTAANVSVEAAAATDAAYTLSYQWYSNTTNSNSGGTLIADATSSSYSIPTGKSDTDSPLYYYCVVTATRMDNDLYASVTSNVAVVTIVKDNITASATGFTGTYDGNTHAINVSVTKPASGATIKYRVGDGAGYGLTEAPSFKDAGTYVVHYQITADHYNTKEDSVTVTINKKQLTVKADTNGKIYGEDDPPLTYTSDGLLENDGFTGALTRATGAVVGTYAISQGSLSAGNNYNIAYTSALFTIYKADVSGPDPEANELTYNKTEQALVTVGETIGGVMQFSTDGENYSPEVPTGKDAGQYTVYYKVVPDDNHNGADTQQVTVTILPKVLTIMADAESKIYGDNDPTLTYTSAGLVDGDVIEGSLARDEGENVGDYVIRRGTLSAGNNYQMNYTESNLTITKADSTIITEPAAKVLLFNGAKQALISAGETEDGTIQYVLGEDDTKIPTEGWDTVIPSAVDPGFYYVWYKVIGDSNHNDSAPVCIPAAIGIIEDITAKRPNPFSTKIENSSEIKALLGITDAEQTLGVDVWLDIQDASGTVSELDKNLILDAREDYEIGQYLNVNLLKKVGNNEPIHITETNGKIRVSIIIPERLRRTDRIFAVIRIHNGVATILPGTYDESKGIFTFESDLFSTYAIIYKDIDDDDDDDDSEPVQVATTEMPAQPRSPKTDDALLSYSFWLMLAAAGFAVSGMAAKGYKKEQE